MMRDRWRHLLSSIVVGLCGLAVVAALVPLALVLFYVLSQGIASLNLAFFTEMPKPVGEAGGGMANSIAGSLIVVGLGALFALPIGIMSGIYAAEYAGTRLAAAVRFAADTLNGVPSIVIGVFVYGIAVLPFRQFSALAGGIALGVMMLPLVARTTEELLLLVPGSIVVSGVLWSLTLVTQSTPPWMILIAHVALSTALAFMFTPLFTSALGSVEPHLYSHASATVGTLQQVAGAAGTALFITVMTATAASAQSGGTEAIAAQAAGVRAAFLVGAIVSLFAIIGATLVRRPADMAHAVAEGAAAH